MIPAVMRDDDLLAGSNPLAGDHDAWRRVVDAVGPAWLLVAIRARMSPVLARRYEVEDVLQETLLHAWRDRGRCAWQGVRAFRAWLLEIASNRLKDLAEHDARLKRGGAGAHVRNVAEEQLPPGTTTPGRLAAWREQAVAMEHALATLPDELREVVRLRLFEELPMEEVAARAGIGVSAAKHRLRKGAEMFRRRLRVETSRPGAAIPDLTS